MLWTEVPVLWRSGLSRLGPSRDQHTGQNFLCEAAATV
ncbi:COMM domain containing 4 (predicted), isoform CRA_d [Rattus norvegicus]|uniref:COMM domain containing 4 (Predicted), isoform CRA_d n=1 Tax=Rattus norvegicus TaxID=10116 RepID=A6J4U0_RAT|nr:COMM domain containing 4 (predicted), isoform CRA_d [Rattus norvegicus]